MKRNIIFVLKKREDVGTKPFNDSKAFIEFSDNMVDIYKNMEDYNPNKNVKYYLFLMIRLLICFVIKILIQ